MAKCMIYIHYNVLIIYTPDASLFTILLII
jgi:hypothetical protein